MGRRHQGRFEPHRRLADERVTNGFLSAGPTSDGKGGRKSGRRRHARSSKNASAADEQAFDDGLGRGSSRHMHRDSHGDGSGQRKKIDGRNILIYLLMAAYLSVASFDYLISQSTKSSMMTSGDKHQQRPSNWSRGKITSFEHKVVPTDEKAEHFFQTGQLPGSSQRLRKNYENRKSREDANYSKGWTSQKAKRIGLEWPPISSLIDGNGKVADGANISGLLDFSIIGFPKTGTTSILRHLSDLTISLEKEHCDLVVNGTAKLVKDIYDDRAQRFKQSRDVEMENQLRGIKCPQDVSSDWSMHNYAEYFPRTKLIVGLRHPIFWFQSLYNFRVSNVPWKKMLPTSRLTKRCPPGSQGVCAWRANFHDFLARLGKTPLKSPSELKLLSLNLDPVRSGVGPVFLYDLSQLSEVAFRKDLRDFLGLSRDIPPFPAVDTSGRFDHISAVKRQTTNEKIDICNPEHDAIRGVLMEKAKAASVWIREYFLHSEDVFVSNRRYLEHVLKSWMDDPCR